MTRSRDEASGPKVGHMRRLITHSVMRGYSGPQREPVMVRRFRLVCEQKITTRRKRLVPELINLITFYQTLEASSIEQGKSAEIIFTVAPWADTFFLSCVFMDL